VSKPNAVILGAGLSGLAAAHDLLRAGFSVTVVDAMRDLGGLASSIVIESHPIERFYHFICRHDDALIELVREFGLEHHLEWHAAKTAFFYEGKHYRFGGPFDLLRFDPVPFDERIRFGLHIMQSRFRTNWRWLDQIPAKPWVIENVGERAYDVIWHPLLKIKFGDDYEKVSAAWLWHRIWRVASSRKTLLGSETFGVLSRGTATIVDELVRRIEDAPLARLRRNTRVERIELDGGRVRGVRLVTGETIRADVVLSTAALPVLDKLLGSPEEPYFAKVGRSDTSASCA
jgi:protoporphyrinogen oxidase